MSSPRVGVVRRSMLSNPHIIKAPLGRCRTVPGLPGPDFVYGTRSSNGTGGVAEVVSSVGTRPGQADSAALPLVSLNRDAVRSGLVTSKQMSQYRAQRGGALGGSAPRQQRGPGASRRPDPIPDIMFGVRNRPPSPISDVLSYQYARRWTNEQLNRKQTNNPKPKVRSGCVDTRTSLLRRTRSLPVIEAPSRPPQFKQVSAALDTFRSPAVHSEVFGPGGSARVSTRGRCDPGPSSLD